jgi:hypothetical protein
MTVHSKIAIFLAALVGAAGAVAVAPPAQAISVPKFTGTGVCDAATATYTVTWTVTSTDSAPATVSGVSVVPAAPISTPVTGIAVGDVLESKGTLTATATVHSYPGVVPTLRLYLNGGFSAYGQGLRLPVCGEPVLPTVSFASDCEHLAVTVAMPEGGYDLPLKTSPEDTGQPPLVVRPGAPAQTRTFFWYEPEKTLAVSIPEVGQIATGRWEQPTSCVSPPLGIFKLFAQANFQYVIKGSADVPGGPDTLRAVAFSPKPTETNLEFLDAGDGDIAIRQAGTSALVTFANEGEPLRWTSTAYVRDAQRFRMVNNTDGTISLRAKINGKYVTAEKAGKQPLYANRTAIGPWEKFSRFVPGKAPVPIYSESKYSFVTAESAGKRPLIANRYVVGHWEFFYIQDLGNGDVALKSLVNGKYVCAESAGKKPLIANRAAVGPWETFTLVQNADGTQSLRAKVNGRYVTSEARRTTPLIANRTAIGPWEKFTIYG